MPFGNIIVGAGMAGLYAAYMLKLQDMHAQFVILEASNRIGGRVCMRTFSGVKVVAGAGIGRPIDVNLISLLDTFKVPYKKARVKRSYIQTIAAKTHAFGKMLGTLRKNKPKPNEDVRAYGNRILGKENYETFVDMCGYGTFEGADARHALATYPFNAMSPLKTNIIYAFDWDVLLSRMVEFIGRENILVKHPVTCVIGASACVGNVCFTARHKVILATDIKCLKKLLPLHKNLDFISGQPNLRVYAQLDPESNLSTYANTFTILQKPLRKIIPINLDKNIFMISYCDNQDAKTVKKAAATKDYVFFEKQVQEAFPKVKMTIKIKAMWYAYWPIGTHFFKPGWDIRMLATQPSKDTIIVGELVSQKHGWVEGALESVRTALG